MLDTFAQTIASRYTNRNGTSPYLPQRPNTNHIQEAPTARPIPAWGAAPCTTTPDTRGLKARPIPAWGEAPCWAISNARGLKARPIPLIPQIPLVALHTVLLQERTKLVLKRTLSMMRLLRVDVLNQRLQICRPNRKRSIPSLPRERRQCRRFCFDPLRRRCLQLRNQFCHIRRSRQTDCEMHMVCYASHAITLASGIANNRGKIRIQFHTDRIIQSRSASFRTEDHMHHNERERQWHRHEYRSGLQPSPVTRNTSWGCAPCWYRVAPLALCAEAR